MKKNSGGIPTLNAFWLKIIMLLPMALDHIYYYMFPRELLPMHYAARVVAPVFAFLTAQSMLHTRNRERYIWRLLCAGTMMAVGNLAISAFTGIYIPNNIFLSLAAGAAIIYCADRFRNGPDRPLWAALCALIAVASMYCEGGHIIPMTVIICYYLHSRRALMYGVYILLSGLPYAADYLTAGSVPAQFWMISAVLPIALYNGERGPSNAFAKYFFYFFYPLHIWIIVFVRFLTF